MDTRNLWSLSGGLSSELWKKDLIYQGTRVVPFSTALGTVLSNFEASSNYQDVQDPADHSSLQSKGSGFLHRCMDDDSMDTSFEPSAVYGA